MLDRRDHLVRRQAELARHTVDNPAVGLVRHQPVKIGGAQPVRAQRFVHRLAQALHRLSVDFASLHAQEAAVPGRRGSAVNIEGVVIAAVGCKWVDSTPRPCGPGSLTARRASAPAPSPNSTQVLRSSQSRMREKVSAPMTIAVLAWPRRSALSAVAKAKTKPAHTAWTSKAAPRCMPKRA